MTTTQTMTLYNSMTRHKEVFESLEPGKVKLYACGPTVYDFAHIGNLRTYIFEDTLRKTLEFLGYEVLHVMNITDVGHLESDADAGDDKMQKGAEREKKSVWDIAKDYEAAFFQDTAALNIAVPHIVSRATAHIQDMIDFIVALEAKGFTYTANGNVYFSIDRFPAYGRLSNVNLDHQLAGSRVDVDPHKQNPLDFVLWFTSSKFPNQVMKWPSPWGVGFPGWHIECSAMAMKYLGNRMDIHCGGIDHIPIHHTNEIAQSEALTGEPWVNLWSHGEFLVTDGGKMSKSAKQADEAGGDGGFLTLSKLKRDGFEPMAYRYFCLQSRYRKQLVFSYESLEAAAKGYGKLLKRVQGIRARQGEEKTSGLADGGLDQQAAPYLEQFTQSIADDLNMPNALTVLYEVIKATDLGPARQLALINRFDEVLSLGLLKAEATEDQIEDDQIRDDHKAVQALLESRLEARRLKHWEDADRLRAELETLGYEVIDRASGSDIKKRRA